MVESRIGLERRLEQFLSTETLIIELLLLDAEMRDDTAHAPDASAREE
jgi:hypothetical protein